MATKEEILDKHVMKMVGLHDESYATIEEMRDQPEYKMMLGAMEEYKNQPDEPIVKSGSLKNKLDAILLEIPLDIRFRVSNQMAFISLLTELGFREDKIWSDDENELLDKLMTSADNHTTSLLKELKGWENDGKPEKKHT